jgi:hypothetical protein
MAEHDVEGRLVTVAVEHAYQAVRIALAALADVANEPTLSTDQRDNTDRFLAQAHGSLVQAIQVTTGRLPADVLAAEQERILGRR